MALNTDEQLYEMIGRIRERKHGGSSRAAAVIKTPSQMMVADNPNRTKSKAASGNQNQYQTVVTEYRYDMGGSASSDNIVYKCGPHNYETMNLKEFNRAYWQHT